MKSLKFFPLKRKEKSCKVISELEKDEGHIYFSCHIQQRYGAVNEIEKAANSKCIQGNTLSDSVYSDIGASSTDNTVQGQFGCFCEL